MTAARKIDPTPEAQASTSPAPAASPRKARVARLTRPPVFPPAEVTHRRPIEPEPVMPPNPDRMSRLRERTGLLVQMLLADERRQKQAAEFVHARTLSEHDREAERARRQAKADAFFRKDRGPDGGAMEARPSEVVVTNLQTGAVARQMLDHNPLHWMNLDILQEEAAGILGDTWRDALPAMEKPGGFSDGNASGVRHLSHLEQIAAGRAWEDYQKWMAEVQRQTSAEHATAVRDAVILFEPAAAQLVREGLYVLVQLWDLR